jgi:hypothetical protein
MTWSRLAHPTEIAELAFSNRTFGTDTRIMSVCRADS